MANALNVSSLVSNEALLDLIDMTPIIELGGKLPERQFKETMYAPGLTVNVPKQNFLLPGSGLTVTPQALAEETVPVSVDPLINVALQFNSLEELLEVGSPTLKLSTGWKERVLRPATMALKNGLETLLVSKMSRSYYMTTGAAGTPLNGLSSLSPAKRLFGQMEIPQDDLVAFVDPYNYMSISNGLYNVFNQPFNNSILRELNLPNVGGFAVMASNYIGPHQFGNVAYSGNTITVKTTATEGAATLVLTGVTSGTTLNPGDRFQVKTGTNPIVYVTPTGKVITQDPITFVVQQTATASGADITVTVALDTGGFLIRGTTGTPRQIMSRLPAAGDAVTFLCNSSTGIATYDFCVNPTGSYTVIGLKLPELKGAENTVTVDPKSQMSIRSVVQGQILTSTNTFRLDLAPVTAAYADYGTVLLS